MSGRKLLAHSAVYGLADVFTNVVSFLLIPVFTSYLGGADYGNLALLMLFGTVSKIVFRLGLDAAYFRLYYDQSDEASRRRLAGSVALLAAMAATLLMALVVLLAPWITGVLFSAPAPPRHWVVLVAADVFLGTFCFVPLNLLRIAERPGLFSAFSVGRHTLNIGLKVGLLMRGWGVPGVLWSDALATGALAVALLPILLRRASPAFDPAMLRSALAFGLPKIPHGLLLQIQNLADRRILDAFVTRAEVGIYSMGYNFGQGVKFATSAFEPAWAPYVYSWIGKPDAPRQLARMATYAFTVFAACGLGLAVLGPDLLVLMTRRPEFHAGAPLVPVIGLAYVFHGVFLLTSIGIGIEKKTRYYPLLTAVTAAVNLTLNFLLIPSFGMWGAAWATLVSYVAMAGLGFLISQRLYPIPWEGARAFRIGGAALLVYVLSLALPSGLWVGLLSRALLLAAFPALLLAGGTLTDAERTRLRALLGSVWGR